MIRTILPQEMKQVEQRFMRERGIPGLLLMERAASAVADAIARHAEQGAAVLFLCGPGNNGGDGYAAARLWQAQGGVSTVWELAAATAGDAGINRRLAAEAGVRLVTLTEAPDCLPPVQAVVDALFGTGLSRPPEGIAEALIRLVNGARCPVIAVDIPSGLNGATGEIMGCAVRAAETVTFHRPKPGLYLRQGCLCAGKITCAPILIPGEDGCENGLLALEESDIPRLLRPRRPDSHKGTFGRVLLIVGSEGMAGAAALCASACVRAGAGLTSVLCRAAVLPVVQQLVPGATCTLLPEVNGHLTADAAGITAEALSRADMAAIGCGLGQDPSLLPLLNACRKADCPVVWDADALNLLAAHPECLPLPAKDTVTPHPGEAARLLDCDTQDILRDPLASLDALYKRCGCKVILKGARSLMTDGVHRAVNPIGTPALAKGGSGDVLTGILTALHGRINLSDGYPDVVLLQAACWIHSLAGIRAAAQCGEDCVTPEELAAAIRLR